MWFWFSFHFLSGSILCYEFNAVSHREPTWMSQYFVYYPPPSLHTASVSVTFDHCSRSIYMFCHLIVPPYNHLHSISYKIASLSFNKIWSTIIFFNSSIEISTSSAKHPQSGLKYRLVIQGLTFPCKLGNFVSLRHPHMHTCPFPHGHYEPISPWYQFFLWRLHWEGDKQGHYKTISFWLKILRSSERCEFHKIFRIETEWKHENLFKDKLF